MLTRPRSFLQVERVQQFIPLLEKSNRYNGAERRIEIHLEVLPVDDGLLPLTSNAQLAKIKFE